MVQCKCKTNDGSRCKRPANPKSDLTFCSQHNKISSKKSPKKSAKKSPKKSYRMCSSKKVY